jgi:two-component system, NarL family, response regulator DevR
MSKLRIILVDDHEVVRIGLKTMLSRYPDFEVVDEASTGLEAVRKVVQHRPDIVILDVRLSGMSGIEACKEIVIKAPGVKVIMLTSYGDDDTLFESIAAGASGYVLKQVGSDDLVKKIQEVGRGEAAADAATTSRMFARMREMARKREESAFSLLTEQELRVLALLAEGKTNREIADALVLGEGTVRNYVSSVFSKLHVSNRAEAAAYAAAHNVRDYL